MTGTVATLDSGLALDVLLRDGTIAQVRLVANDDGPALEALNARVSVKTRFLRYLSLSDQPGIWYVDQVLRSARTGDALVAMVGSTIVALASFARLESDPHVGDLGLLVDDEHQVHGVGALLLEHLAVLARQRGIRYFHADVLQENYPMLRLLRDSGFAVTSTAEHGVAELRVDLAEAPSLWEAVQRRDNAAEHASLEPLLRPKSIAVVGSTRPGGVAAQVHASLTKTGFTGRLDHLDRTGSVAALDAAPDLVIIAVPADLVLGVARDAAARGAKGLLVLSAGFAEAGPIGLARQRELLGLCRGAGMRLIGPNCLGIVNTDPAVALNATFCDAEPRIGSLALVSQSGAVGIAALRHAEQRGAGLSLFVSTGNKADVSGNDLLAYLQDDPRTNVIGLYLESFGNARKFARLARSVGRTKPIVVVKAGRSAAGALAGQSHTAAATTPDIAVEALLHEAGVLRAADLDELFDIVTVLSSGRLPTGPRVVVIGNSGGPGVLAADACDAAGLVVAELAESTRSGLEALLPDGASVRNPVDLLATVRPAEFAQAVRLVAADPAVDAVVAIYTPLMRGAEQDYASALRLVQAEYPETPVVAAFPGLTWSPDGLAPVPFFEFPERAVRALGRTVEYALTRDAPEPPQPSADPQRAIAARTLLDSLPGQDRWLPPGEAVELLSAYGIPCAPILQVSSATAAADAATQLGFPVALKASGPKVVHKADVGGLAFDLTSGEQVAQAYRDLEDSVGVTMTGAIVQRMATTSGRLELLVGLTVDPSIGPLLLVGAGGTLTDLLDDRVVRVPPTSRAAALDQLAQLRCAPLFAGYRHRPALDLEAVADVMLALSALARDLPEVRELDINPLLVGRVGASGLDVRVRIGPPADVHEQAARTLTR